MDTALDLLFGQHCEEPLDLVDPRGAGRGEMHMPARAFGKPITDNLGLVRGVIVHDDVDVEIARYGIFDTVKELSEFCRAVPGIAFVDDLAGCDIECCEQRCRAMARIVMVAPFDLAGAHRQQRLSAIKCLYLRLFINA